MAEPARPSRMVGILGGMGPAATADFYSKLICATPAEEDQDHLRVVMWADPTVPNRHEALIEGGVDPTPWLEKGITQLVRCGAEIIVAPCNTVHAYLPSILDNMNVEFISIIGATVEAVHLTEPGDRVGVIAADGALASGLYQRALLDTGIEPVIPSASSQRTLMQLIYGVKAGDTGIAAQQQLTGLLEELGTRNVSTVIIGCTEVSVLAANLNVSVETIDPSQVLALKTVERALTKVEIAST